jgi:peptide/nickel transport system ATP-binding protein
VHEVIERPLHPYTRGLMGSIPTIHDDRDRLVQIPGSMPRLTAIPPGCPFHPRCQHAFAPCAVRRPNLLGEAQSQVACWLYREAPAEAAE